MADSFPRYCVTCGTELVRRRVEGRERAYCPACATLQYRNPRPCAGVLVVDGERALLVERTNPPGVGTWSVPAGFLEYDEPAPTAAVRELAEETGLSVPESTLSLLTTTHVTHPDGRTVLVIVYTVHAREATGTVAAGSDAADAAFWNLSELSGAGERVEPGYREVVASAVDAES